MTIDKAIEILREECIHAPVLSNPDLKDAMHLGIEAMNLLKKIRVLPTYRYKFFLPGETVF